MDLINREWKQRADHHKTDHIDQSKIHNFFLWGLENKRLRSLYKTIWRTTVVMFQMLVVPCLVMLSTPPRRREMRATRSSRARRRWTSTRAPSSSSRSSGNSYWSKGLIPLRITSKCSLEGSEWSKSICIRLTTK